MLTLSSLDCETLGCESFDARATQCGDESSVPLEGIGFALGSGEVLGPEIFPLVFHAVGIIDPVSCCI